MAKKVLNSCLSFARNIIFSRKYAVAKLATAPSSETLAETLEKKPLKSENDKESK